MTDACPKCSTKFKPGAVACENCGAQLGTDLFDMGDISREMKEEKEEQANLPPPTAGIPKPDQGPKLELDLPENCKICGMPLKAGKEQTKGHCLICEAKGRHRDPLKTKFKSVLEPGQGLKRTEEEPVPGVKKKGLHPGLFLLLAVGLAGIAVAVNDFFLSGAAGDATSGESKSLMQQALEDRTSGSLTPAQATEAVKNIVGGLPVGGSGSDQDPLADLESRLVEGNMGNGDFEAYIEQVARQGGRNEQFEKALLQEGANSNYEKRALALASLSHDSENPAENLKALAEIAAAYPDNAKVQAAYAEALGASDPEAALAKVKGLRGAEAMRARSLALVASGQVKEAMPILKEMAERDLTSARTYVECLARAGRCQEGQKTARRIAASSGVNGAVFWLRFQTLCDGNNQKSLSKAGQILQNEEFDPRDRAQLAATVAMTHLWQGNVAQAIDFCHRAAGLAPDLPAVRGAQARCRLAQGKVPEDARLAQGNGIPGKLLAGATLLGRGVSAEQMLKTIPNWSAGGALLRSIQSLRAGKSRSEVLGEIRGAMLAPRWDGSSYLPMSATEMTQLASLAPEKEKEFVRVLAKTLSHQNPGSAASPAKIGKAAAHLIQASIAYRRGDARGLRTSRKLVKKYRKNPLARFFIQLPQKKKLAALAKDPQLAPYLLKHLKKIGKSKPSIEKDIRRRWPSHPSLVSAEIGL